MKTINYTGSSKLISRIVNLLNRKVPLPLDGDGNPDWGTNGQVLSTNGVDEAVWVNAGGGGGGDTVLWTQVQATGTKIAEININGTSTDVYVPNDSWKFWQAVNGNTSISLPAQWSDLQIIAYQSTNIFDFNISHVAADYYHTNIDSRMMLASGRYATSSAYNSILIDLYESSINIRSSYRNGSDDLANSKLIVFYQ